MFMHSELIGWKDVDFIQFNDIDIPNSSGVFAEIDIETGKIRGHVETVVHRHIGDEEVLNTLKEEGYLIIGFTNGNSVHICDTKFKKVSFTIDSNTSKMKELFHFEASLIVSSIAEDEDIDELVYIINKNQRTMDTDE